MAYDIGQTCMLINIGLTRSECASWVQAWGSIAGILAAALGIIWQVRKQRQQAQEAQTDQGRAIANAVFWCRMHSIELVSMTTRSRNFTSAARQVKEWIADLDAIPLLAYPSFESKNAVRRLIACGRELSQVDAVPGMDDHARSINYVEIGRRIISTAEGAELLIESWLRRHGSSSPLQAYFVDGVTYNPIRRAIAEGKGVRSA